MTIKLEHAIVHGSCEQLAPSALAAQPDGRVMICDPPYSAHVHANAVGAKGAQIGVRQRDLGFASLTAELRNHIAALGAQCRWSVVFCDFEGVAAWRDAFDAQPGYRYLRCVPWVRWSMPQLSGDRPPQGAEAIVLAAPSGPLRWNGPGFLTHFDEKCERGRKKHTAAKPLDLMCRLVHYFSDPGELVFDPTAGRGTTILAAKLLKRSALGFEVQAEEARLGAKRLGDSGCLSDRDAERWGRFREQQNAEHAEMLRAHGINERARRKSGLKPKAPPERPFFLSATGDDE